MSVLFLLLFFLNGSRAIEQPKVRYSFRAPSEWGTLALENANCCPRAVKASNTTDNNAPLPVAIGLGVQKGGSTSLTVYMSRHSRYISSWPKETHFYDKDKPRKNVKAYQRAWRNRGNAQSIRYEFTPSYLWVPVSACRIKRLMPNVKFMVVLRDPADRAYSEFNMVRTRCRGGQQMCDWVHSDFYDYIVRGVGNLNLRGCTFNNGTGDKNWNDCFQCLLFNGKYRRVCKYRPYYFKLANGKQTCFFFGAQLVSRGLYAAQLAWWFELFPPENFLIINSHEFFKDSMGQLKRVNEFFGVKKEFKSWMTHSQGMKGKYKFKDPNKEKAKEYLREFYQRPNQELYQLLDEVRLGPFTPFEDFQRSLQEAKIDEQASAFDEEAPSPDSGKEHSLEESTETERTHDVSPETEKRFDYGPEKESPPQERRAIPHLGLPVLEKPETPTTALNSSPEAESSSANETQTTAEDAGGEPEVSSEDSGTIKMDGGAEENERSPESSSVEIHGNAEGHSEESDSKKDVEVEERSEESRDNETDLKEEEHSEDSSSIETDDVPEKHSEDSSSNEMHVDSEKGPEDSSSNEMHVDSEKGPEDSSSDEMQIDSEKGPEDSRSDRMDSGPEQHPEESTSDRTPDEAEEHFQDVKTKETSSEEERMEQSIVFHASQNVGGNFKSPGLPRGGYYLGITILVVATAIWLARSSRRRQTRYSPLRHTAR